MKFARPKKNAVLLYLNDKKQTEYDNERWRNRPDCIGDEFGNKFRCLFCGAPSGKQCMMANGTFRNYPHQKRRDVAFAYKKLRG